MRAYDFRARVCLLAVCFWASLAQAQKPEEVNRAIDRGIDYLKSRQLGNGGWENTGDYHSGNAALVTLALLSCDVPVDDPRIVRALDYLRRFEPEKTYVVALQTMVFATAKPKGYFPIVQRNARWLMNTRLKNGMWEYPGRNSSGDNSNTQFALLGLHAAAEAGVKIPAEFWATCKQHWVREQTEVGSWGYTGRGAVGTMTAAGVASLIITSQQMQSTRTGQYKGQPVRCNGAAEDRNLNAGLRWLGSNFSATTNPAGQPMWQFYYLYGIERAGRLSGRRFLGDHDWYRAGARYLATSQNADGSWDTNGIGFGPSPIFNTAFSLLFLSKGRIPILINKLKFGVDEDWNNAPNDIHNLTQFVARAWNKKLNWQIVDLRIAKVEDLLQAPIVHMSGHRPPALTPAQKKVLKEYVEQGGLLVADSNCSVDDFETGFRELCKDMFTEPGHDLRRIEPEHGVWRSLFDLTKVADTWPLYGLDIGCRTGVFFSSEDLTCQWEHQEDLENPKSLALPAFRLGANIVAYATGPEQLADKLEERKVYKDGPDDEIQRNYLQVAKIRHNGDWNPAPRAIRTLMASLRDQAKIDVVRQQRDLDLLDPNLPNYPLVYMHGRTRFQLTKKEIENLAEHLKSGGVLFADACCGNERFDEAFRVLAKELFPDKPLTPIPEDHELYTEAIGYDIRKVKLGKALLGKETAPLMEGVLVDNRYVLIYSKYDIGCALERQQGGDCKGYAHESAVKIASNVVLYALKQ